VTEFRQGKGDSLVKIKCVGNGAFSISSRRLGYPITLVIDDEFLEFVAYSRYVDAVTRRGPYNVLTLDYWRAAPKPIVHPKLGVIES